MDKIKTDKKAFTLAEVLITLTIIGVIAALTIPNLYLKYQKHVWATQVKKVYSELNHAQSVLVSQFGNSDTWDLQYGKSQVPQNDLIQTFSENLNAKICANYNQWKNDVISCNGLKTNTLLTLNKLPANSNNWENGYSVTNGTYQLELKNGTTIIIRFRANSGGYSWALSDRKIIILYTVDVNGKAQPNQFGRDIFQFALYENTNTIKPYNMIDTSDCANDKKGFSCAGYLYNNGWKMNY